MLYLSDTQLETIVGGVGWTRLIDIPVEGLPETLNPKLPADAPIFFI
jgi:hypothetical protein